MNPIHLAVCLTQNFPGAGKLKVSVSSLQALLIRVEMFRRSISRKNRHRVVFNGGIGNNSMGYESLIIAVLAAGMLLFGSKKLPDLCRSLGRAKSEYNKGKLEAQRELGRIQGPLDGDDTRRKSLV